MLYDPSGGSGLVQEAWAASLWLVAANDVLISAAYKVNPISGCHTVREQKNKEARETDLSWEMCIQMSFTGIQTNQDIHVFRLSWRLRGYLDVISWLCSIAYWGFYYMNQWAVTGRTTQHRIYMLHINTIFEILTQKCTKSSAIDDFSHKWAALTTTTQKTSRIVAIHTSYTYLCTH